MYCANYYLCILYPMSILTRKRRRSDALQDDAEEHQEENRGAGTDTDGDDAEQSGAEAGDVSDEVARKQRDAFKEEQYESA